MRKTIIILLAIVLCLFASCSKGSDSKATTASAAATSAPAAPATQSQTTTAQTSGIGAAAEKPAEPAAPAATQPAELAPATIKVWYSISGTNGQFFESQVKAFAEKYPQIKVELTYTGSYADSATKISAAKLAGNSPDIAITSASQLYTGEDDNFQIEQDVKDPEFNLADVRPGILEYANYRGRLAAVPFSISTQVIYYNKDL
ncbi:MAG: extracellular solute-binding protein, partial [Spirochaetales bacterium]|nr:extracellular solute-binding protein [Spirochaetales bacterium]